MCAVNVCVCALTQTPRKVWSCAPELFNPGEHNELTLGGTADREEQHGQSEVGKTHYSIHDFSVLPLE